MSPPVTASSPHDRHGARRRARQAHAADHRDDAEAAREGRRPSADRPHPRPAGRGRHRPRRRQRASPRRSGRSASCAARRDADDRRSPTSARSCSKPAAASRRRCRSSARSRSSPSTRIPSGSRGRSPISCACSRHGMPARMDVLMLVARAATSLGYEGRGDFAMDADGRLRRRGEREVAPFVYAGVAIVKPALFDDTPDGAFSANLLFDQAQRGRPALRVAARRPVAACRRRPQAIAAAEGAHRRKRALSAMARLEPRLLDPARLPFLPTLADALLDGRLCRPASASTPPRSPTSPSTADPPRRPGAGRAPRRARRRGGRSSCRASCPRRGRRGGVRADRARAARRCEEAAGLAPPIPPLERRLILTRLVQRWSAEVGPRAAAARRPTCPSWCRPRPPTR